jgi:FG-GAP-like repeat
MRKSTLIATFAFSAMITGCGGGGGGGNNQGSAEPVALVASSTPALSTSDNSYKNFKQIGLSAQNLPAVGDARAYGHFSGGTDVDLFVATLNYFPGSSAPQTARTSTFAIYKKQIDGSYTITSNILTSSTGCIHPRKAIVADFNGDGKPDIFVACHGYDAPPFPGERSKVILSQSNGTYQTTDASSDVGFFHGASAADLNGDGYPDVVLANNFDPKSVLVLINKKDGTFQRETGTRLPTRLAGKNYFSIEMIDINGDGVLDLLVGGHEWEGATTLAFINPGNNIFEGSTPITIPAVSNEGVVLDFVATNAGSNRQLWILRTSGGDGTFYQSRTLQRVNLADLSSTVVVNNRPANWVRWILPTIVSGQNTISSENIADNLNYNY